MLLPRTGCAELPLCWGQALGGLTDPWPPPQLCSGTTSHDLWRSSQPGWAHWRYFALAASHRLKQEMARSGRAGRRCRQNPSSPLLPLGPKGCWDPQSWTGGRGVLECFSARIGRFEDTHKHTHSQRSAQTDAASQALLRFIGVADQGECKLGQSLSAKRSISSISTG